MKPARFAFALALVVTTSAALASSAGRARATAPQELEQLQSARGAQYAQELFQRPAKWQYVSTQIESGDRGWLQVAKSLLPHADGAFAEELTADLATALLRRPANVLRLLKQSSDSGSLPRTVCDAPFPSPGKTWLGHYKARAIRSVAKVHEPDLRQVRDDCLKALRAIDLSQSADAYQ